MGPLARHRGRVRGRACVEERTAGSNITAHSGSVCPAHSGSVRTARTAHSGSVCPAAATDATRRRLRDDAPGKYAWLAVRVRIRTRVRAIGCRVCSRGVGKCADLWHSLQLDPHWCARAAQPPRRRESLCDGLLYTLFQSMHPGGRPARKNKNRV